MLPAIDGYVAPAQVRNIAYTQSALAGKQKCPAYILLDIGGVLQFADFVKGQELTLAFRSRYLFLGAQQFPRIVLYIPFLPGSGQDDAENPETGTGGGLGERLSLRSERFGLKPLGIIGTESLVYVTQSCTGAELLEFGT